MDYTVDIAKYFYTLFDCICDWDYYKIQYRYIVYKACFHSDSQNEQWKILNLCTNILVKYMNIFGKNVFFFFKKP